MSPALLHLYDTKDKNVIIIDIFRATSTITAAIANGAKTVVPVASVEECINLSNVLENCITAGERDGKVAPGLSHGNSPLEYDHDFIAGKNLALTTTNGTRLLHMVKDAANIIIGSFLNVSAVCDFLMNSDKDVILACASWKDRVNMEDTLFAGAVVAKIGQHFNCKCDSAMIAKEMYKDATSRGDLLEYLKDSSHYRRLTGFGLMEDLIYCTTEDKHDVVPVLKGNVLVDYKTEI